MTDGKAAGRSGVPHAEQLVAFAEAAVGDDADATTGARDALLRVAGPEAVVDAAAVAANFQRMVRIADGTGIPLDGPLDMISAGLREELGIDQFGSSVNTPTTAAWKRTLGRTLEPLLRFALRRAPAPRRPRSS